MERGRGREKQTDRETTRKSKRHELSYGCLDLSCVCFSNCLRDNSLSLSHPPPTFSFLDFVRLFCQAAVLRDKRKETSGQSFSLYFHSYFPIKIQFLSSLHFRVLLSPSYFAFHLLVYSRLCLTLRTTGRKINTDKLGVSEEKHTNWDFQICSESRLPTTAVTSLADPHKHTQNKKGERESERE